MSSPKLTVVRNTPTPDGKSREDRYSYYEYPSVYFSGTDKAKKSYNGSKLLAELIKCGLVNSHAILRTLLGFSNDMRGYAPILHAITTLSEFEDASDEYMCDASNAWNKFVGVSKALLLSLEGHPDLLRKAKVVLNVEKSVMSTLVQSPPTKKTLAHIHESLWAVEENRMFIFVDDVATCHVVVDDKKKTIASVMNAWKDEKGHRTHIGPSNGFSRHDHLNWVGCARVKLDRNRQVYHYDTLPEDKEEAAKYILKMVRVEPKARNG